MRIAARSRFTEIGTFEIDVVGYLLYVATHLSGKHGSNIAGFPETPQIKQYGNPVTLHVEGLQSVLMDRHQKKPAGGPPLPTVSRSTLFDYFLINQGYFGGFRGIRTADDEAPRVGFLLDAHDILEAAKLEAPNERLGGAVLDKWGKLR